MADAQIVDDQEFDTASLNAASLLAALLEHPLVTLYRYADDGPPAAVPPTRVAGGEPVYGGWAVVSDRQLADGIWQVVLPTTTGYAIAAVVGNAPEVAENDLRTDAYRDLDEADARARRRKDALAAQVASQAVNADIYVTSRPYLHAARWKVAPGVTLCGPEEALSLLSLYLRAQGEFLVAPKLNFNRGLFYWVGTRELLDEAWRWFNACVQHSSATKDETLLLLGGSLLQGVDRALEQRDAIHVALNQAQNNDLREDALASLDVVLVLLMGAVDAAARVAHRVLGWPTRTEHRAGWQHTKAGEWLPKVAEVCPDLATAVAVGTAHQQTLTILRLLRNSVHGVALQGIAYERAREHQETLIGLPVMEEAGLLAAMDTVGGRSSWGVQTLLPGRTHIDPGILADRLFSAVLELLNELMAKTPVESMPHVHLTAADNGPPSTRDPMDPFATWMRTSIRLQLGLN